MNIVTANTLVIYSSPKKDGATMRLLNTVLDALNIKTPQTVNVYDLHIMPCVDCKVCFKGDCPLNSDDMSMLLEKIHNADIVICATPVYFNSVPAPFKLIFDRFEQLYVKKLFLQQPIFTKERNGILLTTAGDIDTNVTVYLGKMFEMFFSCINANFIKHIAITDCDNVSDFTVEQQLLTDIKDKLV